MLPKIGRATMVKNLGTPTREELIRALKERYMESSKKEKTKILESANCPEREDLWLDP
jgi:hypothetical protein